MFEGKWQSVVSSNIAAIGYKTYDSDMKCDLFVRFNSGAEYTYHNVPTDVVQEFLDAGSKGGFFAANIKGKYSYNKMAG